MTDLQMIECPECEGSGWFSPVSRDDQTCRASGWLCCLCGGEGELPWPRAPGDNPGKSATWKLEDLKR